MTRDEYHRIPHNANNWMWEIVKSSPGTVAFYVLVLTSPFLGTQSAPTAHAKIFHS